MKTYKKKPIEIEAVKLTAENIQEVKEQVGNACHEHYNHEGDFMQKKNPIGLMVRTYNGWVLAKIGDYVCKDIAGKFYPCVSDVFEQTHEME